MERILDENEKLRKAEEIYFRRNNGNIHLSKKNKSKNYFGSKILFNLLILFNIAIIVFCFQNKNYIFTNDFLNECSKYNVNISEKINEVIKTFLKEDSVNTDNSIEENNSEKYIEASFTNVTKELTDNNISEKNVQSETKENIVPADVKIQETEAQSSSLSEMELDIENLKKIYKFVVPLEGIVSSGFGARESAYQNVTGYHKGIDIAAEKGTPIKAALQGIVEEVSSEGDYGKHVKIRCNNVTTVYAHCSKILVKKGQIVAEGQEIAKVGSTGNSTGNHLHFEIRVEDRLVDPGRVIEFK